MGRSVAQLAPEQPLQMFQRTVRDLPSKPEIRFLRQHGDQEMLPAGDLGLRVAAPSETLRKPRRTAGSPASPQRVHPRLDRVRVAW